MYTLKLLELVVSGVAGDDRTRGDNGPRSVTLMP
jgi:hypothetical protein